MRILDADMELILEWRRIARKLDALYAAMAAGNDSVLARQRIERLEALQAAFCGFPEALAK
jgi:hypothetical protein